MGEGATSRVFRAFHSAHGYVALKVLKPSLREDRTAVTRFLREARYGERVVHPNVVRTIERGQEGVLQFIALEWADGELLDKYARRIGPLRLEYVADIVNKLASAVNAAHQVDIVHRDLKPDNVMVDPPNGSVKLLDFGIATDTDIAQEDRLTRKGYFVGTLLYLPPEAINGNVLSPAGDQYSLAAIAYFLLTGRLPYTAKTPKEMFSQLMTQEPVPLNSAREGLTFSRQLEKTMMRALAKEPVQRYASVVEFSDALRLAAGLSLS